MSTKLHNIAENSVGSELLLEATMHEARYR